MPAFTSPPLPSTRRRRLPTRLTTTPVRTARPLLPTATLSDVLVIGANRGLGLQIASVLHSQKAPRITSTYRPASSIPLTLSALSTSTLELDALHRAHVHTLLSNVSPSVIISCVGGDVETGFLPDAEATRNLVDAALTLPNLTRFVLLSALGAGDSEDAVPFQVMDTMRPLLLEKSHAEAYLRASKLPWTIARPGPLVDAPRTGSAVVTEGTQCYGTVSREDVADLLVRAADSEKAEGKTLHVVDTKSVLVTSPYVRPLEFWEPLPFEEFML